MYLALKELKQCRLVNKFWKREVDSYVRDLLEYRAKITGPSPCADLKALAQLLSGLTANCSIINGLDIRLSSRLHSEHRNSDQEFHSLYAQVMEKVLLKHLVITWDSDSPPSECPAVKFVTALLHAEVENLVTLKIESLPMDFSYYFDNDWEPVLPKLELLSVGSRTLWLKHAVFFHKICGAAPNLKKLTGGTIHSDILLILPTKTYSLLDSFALFIKWDEVEVKCLALVEADPRLSKLFLSAPCYSERRYMTSFFHVLQRLLVSSCETLKTIAIVGTNIPLNSLTCPPLVAVKFLDVSTNPSPKDNLLMLFRSINYPKLLPALFQVTMYYYNYRTTSYVVSNVPFESHPSTSLKSFRFDAQLMLPLQELSQSFPNVSLVSISSKPRVGAIPYKDLWACWDQLEVILVEEQDLSENFDMDFLGIDPEEVDVLRELDDASLERMHIVPIRPSILTKPRKTQQTLFGLH